MSHHVVYLIDSLHLTDEVLVGFVEPGQVFSFHLHWELFVLINRAVLHLIHHVELSFKFDEFFSRLRLCVDNAFLVLLKCVYNFEEISTSKEKLKVFLAALFYFRLIVRTVKYGILIYNGRWLLTSDSFNWHKEAILVKVVFESISWIILNSKFIKRVRKCLEITYSTTLLPWDTTLPMSAGTSLLMSVLFSLR